MPFNIRTDGCSPGEVAKLTGKMRKPAEARTQQQLQARLLPRSPARPSARPSARMKAKPRKARVDEIGRQALKAERLKSDVCCGEWKKRALTDKRSLIYEVVQSSMGQQGRGVLQEAWC